MRRLVRRQSASSSWSDRLGPINWQLAPTKKYEPDDFAAFLDLLPAEADGIRLRHAVEARHASFQVPEVVEAARQRGVAMILDGDANTPGSPT